MMGENATALLRELSEPRGSGERTKSAIVRAAKLAGLNYWRAFDIWYGKARRIDDFEIDRIRSALRKKSEDAARNEYQRLKARIAVLEVLLATPDPIHGVPAAYGASALADRRGRARRTADQRS